MPPLHVLLLRTCCQDETIPTEEMSAQKDFCEFPQYTIVVHSVAMAMGASNALRLSALEAGNVRTASANRFQPLQSNQVDAHQRIN
jgi:hypothetical protein